MARTGAVARKNRIRKTTEDRVVDTVNTVLLLVIIVLTLYPFYYVLIHSFNLGTDSARGGMFLFPRSFTLSNYQKFFGDPMWLKAIGISVLRTVSGTVLSVFFTCMISYALANQKLALKRFYYVLFIFPMYFSGGLITRYILYREIHLLNTFWVYIVPTALSIFFVIIATSFFREIPAELVESAYLDGAGDMRIYLSIILPISLPLVATMCLYLGVDHWNAWVDSAYFVRDQNLRTISYRLMEVINASMLTAVSDQAAQYTDQVSVTPRSLQMAAMMVSAVPVMVVYPFLQKYFVRGLTVGAVKG